MSLPVSSISRIAHLWSHGVPLATIAAAVGISAGRLTQLIDASPELKQAIVTAEAANIDQDISRQEELGTIETALIRKMPGLISECESLGEATRALATISELQRRKRGLAPNTATGIGAGVQINLSFIAEQRVDVVISPKNDILALGERSVAPMAREKVGGFLDDLHKHAEAVDGQVLLDV